MKTIFPSLLCGLAAWLTVAITFPATAQDLKAILSKEELDQRLARLLQTEGRPGFGDFRRTALPGGGLLVNRVEEGRDAANAGMKVGSVINAFAEYPVWTGNVFAKMPGGNSPTYQWISPGGERIKETYLGNLGVSYCTFFRPENIYANERANHSVDWNEWMVAGLGLLTREPDFAESALAEAIRLGYPKDDLIDFSDAVLGAMLGDAKRLAAARDRFFTRFPAGTAIPGSYNSGLEALLIASHGLAGFERWVNEQGPAAPLTVDLVEKFKGWSAADGFDRHGRSPAERAGEMEKIDLRTRWGAIADPEINTQKRSAPFLTEDGKKIEIGPGKYHVYFLGNLAEVPVRNLAVRMEFKASVSGSHERWSNTLDITLVNRRHGIEGTPPGVARRNPPLLSQTLACLEYTLSSKGARGYQSVTGGGIEYAYRNSLMPLPIDESRAKAPSSHITLDGLECSAWFAQSAAVPAPEKHSVLEMIRVDGGVQILLDGRTLLHMPVDPTIEDVGFMLRAVGMTLDIASFRVWELKPK